MREHPDHHDAELLLRLYDLRREIKLRQAREWFIREFQVKSVEDLGTLCPAGSDNNAFFRMLVSYWDMAASMVNHGLINEEFFFENTSEFWVVWDRVKSLVPQLRQGYKNPHIWKNLETLAGEFERWMTKRAPGALDATRERIRQASQKENP